MKHPRVVGQGPGGSVLVQLEDGTTITTTAEQAQANGLGAPAPARGDPAAIYDQGAEAYRAGRFEEAASFFEAANALKPNAVASAMMKESMSRVAQSPRAHYAQAADAFRAGDFNDSARMLAETNALQPNEATRQAFEQANAAAEQSPRETFDRARVDFLNNRFTDAAREFDQANAIQASPEAAGNADFARSLSRFEVTPQTAPAHTPAVQEPTHGPAPTAPDAGAVMRFMAGR